MRAGKVQAEQLKLVLFFIKNRIGEDLDESASTAAEFVKSEIDNSAVFHPCDVQGAVQLFETLKLQDAPRTAFVTKYARTNISQRMAEDILAVAGGER